MARREWSWTPLQDFRAKKVRAIVDNLKCYWPLTLRQIHYQLVARLVQWSPTFTEQTYRNTRSAYNTLSKLVKWMRIDEIIPWRVLTDDHRQRQEMMKHESAEEFIEDELNHFLWGYRRCLVQDQPTYLEVWVEKGALLRICREVAWKYCLPVVACTGYSSVTYLDHFHRKAERAIMQGKTPIVLYLGDLDPSGVQMFEANIQTLENEMGLYGTEYKRIGLNPEQVGKCNLPSDPHAGKMTDSRYSWYVKRYGKMFVELDALHPRDLQTLLEGAIQQHLDIDAYKEQQENEEDDDRLIEELREEIGELIRKKL